MTINLHVSDGERFRLPYNDLWFDKGSIVRVIPQVLNRPDDEGRLYLALSGQYDHFDWMDLENGTHYYDEFDLLKDVMDEDGYAEFEVYEI